MINLAGTPRILKRRKVLDQLLNRHRRPPFVDEGRTVTPRYTVKSHQPISSVAPGSRASIWWAPSLLQATCKRRSNCVPPAGRGSVALSAGPNQFQTRHKLRRGPSFLVSTVLAHGRHNGTRFLRPGGTQLLRRLDHSIESH